MRVKVDGSFKYMLLKQRRIILQIKDRIITKIESVAFGGEGVARVQNFVVFVPFAATGDEMEIEITQLKKSFARGKMLKLIKPSLMRTKPRCRYYGKCGGCCYQHLDYQNQLEIKKKQVEEAFWKIGKIVSPPVLPVIASPETYHYRGKAQYHAELISNDWKIGFLDISGGRLVDIESCEIMAETINEQLRVLRTNQHLWNYQDETLTIWSDCLHARESKEESIIRIVKGKKFLISSDGFFQANLHLTDRLVEEVCRLVSADTGTVVDAYCGSGLFSIFLSGYAKNVTGIEINEKSVHYARRNAENAGVDNVEFISGNVEDVLQSTILSRENKIDLMVLDPPRTGCDKIVLKSVIDLRPKKIIYISCNPATQARDVKYLTGYGYHLRSLLPLDMFPQTEHIEVVGHLEIA